MSGRIGSVLLDSKINLGRLAPFGCSVRVSRRSGPSTSTPRRIPYGRTEFIPLSTPLANNIPRQTSGSRDEARAAHVLRVLEDPLLHLTCDGAGSRSSSPGKLLQKVSKKKQKWITFSPGRLPFFLLFRLWRPEVPKESPKGAQGRPKGTKRFDF